MKKNLINIVLYLRHKYIFIYVSNSCTIESIYVRIIALSLNIIYSHMEYAGLDGNSDVTVLIGYYEKI